MTIERNANGVTDFLFDKLEEIDKRSDLEYDKKLRGFDMILKHVWKSVDANLRYKALLMKAPDIAKNRAIVLELGAGPREVKKVEEKTGTAG